MDVRIYLTIAAFLFSMGIYGVLSRRNAIGVLLSVELMANAVNINLVAFSRYATAEVGQVFALFSIALTVAEVAVGLALVVLLYRSRRDILVDLKLPAADSDNQSLSPQTLYDVKVTYWNVPEREDRASSSEVLLCRTANSTADGAKSNIVEELIAVQGQAVELGGYYRPKAAKCESVMRPSATFNAALAQWS